MIAGNGTKMKDRWNIVGCVLFCFVVFGVQAQQQHPVNKKAWGLFQQARESFREGDKEKALGLLLKAETFDQGFSPLYLLKADIYNKKGDKIQEIRAIETALALDSLKSHPYYYFILAEYYFDEADYGKALAHYGRYLSWDKRLQVKAVAERQMENCRFALEALRTQTKQPPEVFYEAECPVYWPALDVTGQTFLFTEQAGEQETMWMLQGDRRYALNFSGRENCGAPSLTADGRMMYFSRENGRNSFDIYVAYRLSDTSWSEPVNLGAPVNTDGWEAQPAISADGTRLYFASTREGGRGGSDIWFSYLPRREADGRQLWSQPRCLYFNTGGDEMAPFLYFDNKTLFFASDGYAGMGRKDIYKVDVEQVTPPLNIGITVNTQRDEFGFIVDASGQWGYFSSDISGKRCIYRYRLEEEVACPPASYLRLLTVNEAGEPVIPDGLTLTEVGTGDTLACYDRVDARTDMLACIPVNKLLWVSAVKQGYLYYSDTLQVKENTRENPRIYTLCLRPIQKEQTLVLKGIFFDVDDYRLRPESYPELRQLVVFLKQNPEVKIEISGHTDNTGSDQHNYRLSENRAFEVYKYLFLNHIQKERMEYKGYGKDRPLRTNDTEEGRKENRRTEIRVR